MTRRFVRDLVERVTATFAEAYSAFLLASGVGITGVVDMSLLKKAAVAGAVAVLAAFKGLLARGVGDKESASLAVPPVVAS